MVLTSSIAFASSPLALLVLVVAGLVALGSFSIAGRELRTAYRVFSTPTGRG